jgi:hypothetical protein
MRLLTTISNDGGVSKVKHYAGLPPTLTGGKDIRKELGGACFLVIEEDPDGVFLYRYGARGEFVGDTWHMNLDDAKHQASYEYGDSVKGWADVPAEIEDVVLFGLNHVTSDQL